MCTINNHKFTNKQNTAASAAPPLPEAPSYESNFAPTPETVQRDVDLVRLRLEAGDHLLRVFKIGEIIDEQIINVDQPKKYNYFLKKPLSASN